MAVLLVVLFAGCGNGGSSITAGRVTLEQFQQVEEGMTYEKVVDILGDDGYRQLERGNTLVYRWSNYPASGLVTVTFVDEIATNVVQIGLD